MGLRGVGRIIPVGFTAEERGADADHGGPFGDGGLEVVAHAHAHVLEAGPADFIPLDLFENLSRAGEDGAGLVGGRALRGHRHQADQRWR
jgi:hypothetical protein